MGGETRVGPPPGSLYLGLVLAPPPSYSATQHKQRFPFFWRDTGRRGAAGRGGREGVEVGVVHARTHVAYVHMFRREATCAGDEEKT